MYVGWDGREYEDAEMDNMRRDRAEELRQEYKEMEQAAIDRYALELWPLVSKATRDDEYYYLGGCDGPRPLYALQKALQQALADVRRIRYHQHQWNDNDYCDICGNDGRA